MKNGYCCQRNNICSGWIQYKSLKIRFCEHYECQHWKQEKGLSFTYKYYLLKSKWKNSGSQHHIFVRELFVVMDDELEGIYTLSSIEYPFICDLVTKPKRNSVFEWSEKNKTCNQLTIYINSNNFGNKLEYYLFNI